MNLTYPADEKFMFEGNDVKNAFAFLSSRLKSTTVQKVQVCFREEAAPRQQNRIENGNLNFSPYSVYKPGLMMP